MSKKDDGGPAFPETEYYEEKAISTMPGMSLRDAFAISAIPMATKWEEDSPTGPFAEHMIPTYAGIATRAYLLADAMLAEREK